MTLDEIRKAYEDLSGTLSTLCRQLTFAGIAIAWMFIFPNRGLNGLSCYLKASIVIFVITFIVDIIQYTVQTIQWHRFYLTEKDNYIKKNKGKPIDETKVSVLESEKDNKLPWHLFYIKIGLVLLAYLLLFIHIMIYYLK